MITELQAIGFKFKLVLADSLYGESDSNFITVLNKFQLDFVVAIRSNHAVWLPAGQKVRYNKWRKFNRVFSDGTTTVRYIREIIFGKRREVRYWQVTTDLEKLPDNETWFVMTKVPEIKYKEVGNFYGLRTWVEYGLKQSKDQLGWADFRLTHYSQIEKWWEVVCSAYLMVSLYSDSLLKSSKKSEAKFSTHPWWDEKKGWKNLLNNLRLILQPFICFNLIKPWLKVFPIPQLSLGFPRLIALMNKFASCFHTASTELDFYFSSG